MHKRKVCLVDELLDDINEETKTPYFEVFMPKEVVLLVFGYLSPLEIGVCSQVCRSWYMISRDDHLWWLQCKREGWTESSLSSLGYVEGSWASLGHFMTSQRRIWESNWKGLLGVPSTLKTASHVAFEPLPDGGLLIAWHSQPQLHIRHLSPAHDARNWECTEMELVSFLSWVSHKDEKYLLGGFVSGRVSLWRCDSQKNFFSLHLLHHFLPFPGNSTSPTAVAMTTKWVVVGQDGGRISWFDRMSGKCVGWVNAHHVGVTELKVIDFSPKILSIGMDGGAALWSPPTDPTGKEIPATSGNWIFPCGNDIKGVVGISGNLIFGDDGGSLRQVDLEKTTVVREWSRPVGVTCLTSPETTGVWSHGPLGWEEGLVGYKDGVVEVMDWRSMEGEGGWKVTGEVMALHSSASRCVVGLHKAVQVFDMKMNKGRIDGHYLWETSSTLSVDRVTFTSAYLGFGNSFYGGEVRDFSADFLTSVPEEFRSSYGQAQRKEKGHFVDHMSKYLQIPKEKKQ